MTQAFNLAQLANKVNTSGQLDASTGLVNATPVANGGTGLATLTANNLMVGNGTGNVAFIAPGTTGNSLLSNGTSWVSSAPPYAGAKGQVFTAGGTFTIPAGVTAVKVTVIGGGGSAGALSSNYGSTGAGGGGGGAIKYLTGLTSGLTLTVTVGGVGGTSSVASGTQTITTISATGGASSGTNVQADAAPGAGSGGDINVTGNYGSSTTYGGASLFGPGPATQTVTNGIASRTVVFYGAGAAGSNGGPNVSGGTGKAGIVTFEW